MRRVDLFTRAGSLYGSDGDGQALIGSVHQGVTVLAAAAMRAMACALSSGV